VCTWPRIVHAVGDGAGAISVTREHDGGLVLKFGVWPGEQQFIMLPPVQDVAVVTQSPFCAVDPDGQQPPGTGCAQASAGLAGNGEQ
jgi:hypothetical protein